MKKYVKLLLILTIVVSMCGCGKEKNVKENTEHTETVEEKEPVKEEPIEDESEAVEDSDIMSTDEVVDEPEEVVDESENKKEIIIDGDKTLLDEDGMLIKIDRMTAEKEGEFAWFDVELSIENNNPDNKQLEVRNLFINVNGINFTNLSNPRNFGEVTGGFGYIKGGEKENKTVRYQYDYLPLKTTGYYMSNYFDELVTEVDVQSVGFTMEYIVGINGEKQTAYKEFKTDNYKDGGHCYGEKIAETEFDGKTVEIYYKDSDDFTVYTISYDSDEADMWVGGNRIWGDENEIKFIDENPIVIERFTTPRIGRERAQLYAVRKEDIKTLRQDMEIGNDEKLPLFLWLRSDEMKGPIVMIDGNETKILSESDIAWINQRGLLEFEYYRDFDF